MSRIRYLKPDFFKDEDLIEHPFWIRLLYAGLWNLADREGRLEDRPKRIKIELFPYDKVDIEKGLIALATNKRLSNRPFIVRYKVDGEPYIQILSWHKHQKPHHTERQSTIPPLTTPLETEITNGDGKGHEGMTELSNGELTVKEQKKPQLNINQCFAKLWNKYPSKIGKKEAERHFRASVKTEEHYSKINIALENYLKSERVSKGFVQNAKTWFNDWETWVEKPIKTKDDKYAKLFD